MAEPIWVTYELVVAIHHRQLAEHGGIQGIRDEGLLSSALARPRHLFIYADRSPDIATMATAYAYGIAKNHPFMDGNKRTAVVVCETFIGLNAHQLHVSDEELYETFLTLAKGELSEDELVDWIRGRLNRANG